MNTLSIISFLGFTLLVAFIAWYATRKTDESSADGYYLGGRSLGDAVCVWQCSGVFVVVDAVLLRGDT